MMITQIITILVIVFLVAFLNLKLSIEFDIFNNCGIAKIKFFKILIKQAQLQIKDNELIGTNKKNKKIITIPLSTKNSKGGKNDFDILYGLYSVTDIKRIIIKLKFGIENDQFATSIICQTLDILISIILCIQKNTKTTTQIYKSIETSASDSFSVVAKCNVNLSIYDYLWTVTKTALIGAKK